MSYNHGQTSYNHYKCLATITDRPIWVFAVANTFTEFQVETLSDNHSMIMFKRHFRKLKVGYQIKKIWVRLCENGIQVIASVYNNHPDAHAFGLSCYSTLESSDEMYAAVLSVHFYNDAISGGGSCPILRCLSISL